MDKLNQEGQVGSGIVSTGSLKKKNNINVREVENGFVVNYDNGYSYGERTYAAKDTTELLEVLNLIVTSHFK